WRVRRERASGDGWKPRRSAASITAALVAALSSPRPFSAREAVEAETPTDAATSASVAFRRFDPLCSVVNRLRKRLLTLPYSIRGVKRPASTGRRGPRRHGHGARPQRRRAALRGARGGRRRPAGTRRRGRRR